MNLNPISKSKYKESDLSIISDKNLQKIIKELGFNSLYPIQELALSNGLLNEKDLLITSPTASGKTLLTIMAAIKIIEKGKKIVYLSPLKSLANEKYHDFLELKKINFDIIIGHKNKKKSKDLIIKIANSDYNSSGNDLIDANIIVLTNEKLDSLMRYNTDLLSNVGLFIIDEVHIINDKERGPTLEMMITKIRQFYSDSQILALSATISNSEDISNWLNCVLIKNNWRPTNLIEGVYDSGIVRMNNNKKFKIKNYSSSASSASIDLAIDSIKDGGQAIIFAETRKRAVTLAAKSVEPLFQLLNNKEKQKVSKISSQIAKNSDGTDITKNLINLVSKGVGFHHAGLSNSIREKLEKSFREGSIKLLISTPTLAAGVNLPARRVVLSSILRYDFEQGANLPISILEYKQLSGRAGRPKYDTYGESIIVSESGINSDDIYDHYVLGEPEPITSKLANEKAIRFHLLSTISTIPGIKKSELINLFMNTLFAQNYRKSTISFKIDTMLEHLVEYEFIKSKKDRFLATEFGKQTSILYIDPLSAIEFRDTLNLMKNKDTNSEYTLGILHTLSNSTDFYPKLSLRKRDYEIFNRIINNYSSELIYEIDEFNSSRSFLALHEWINETNERDLSDRINIDPGDMHRISESAEWLCYSLYEIAKLFKHNDILLNEIFDLKTRIKYGVKKELLPLVKIENIGRKRARSLYNAGITDINKLKSIPEDKLANISKIGILIAKKIKKNIR
ncbi:MAG: DEAD/DEAH box helicase [Nitrososphaeraceae archaeon]